MQAAEPRLRYVSTVARRPRVVRGRVTEEDDARIRRAAEVLGSTVSAVVAEGASRFAREVLEDGEEGT